VLPLAPDGRHRRYVVYDRQTQRITNGVYGILDDALANAACAEAIGSDWPNRPPLHSIKPTASASSPAFKYSRRTLPTTVALMGRIFQCHQT
jgi:hypothetical protein